MIYQKKEKRLFAEKDNETNVEENTTELINSNFDAYTNMGAHLQEEEHE